MGIGTNRPQDIEYKVVREESHDKLEKELNDRADDGWEPVSYAMWSRDHSSAEHFAILRRAKR